MDRNFTSLPSIKQEEDEDNDDQEEEIDLGANNLQAAASRTPEEGIIQEPNKKINENFLRENGFDVLEYVNQGKFGTVYSAMANESAIKFYPIDQIPKGGVIGENVWQCGHQFYVQKSLTGTRVAIKYVPPPQLEAWDDPQEEAENQLLLDTVGGFVGLLSSTFPERIGHPLEEVRKLIKLNHVNLVEIYNVLSDENHGVYIVMEYFELTLKEWVNGMNENNVRLDDNSMLIFLEQLIGGLSYLHEKNITHNDLHSSNVMVTQDEDECIIMKMVDFGMAEYFNDYNSPTTDIRGLGQLLQLVMTLNDSEHPEFNQALEDFIYTCVKLRGVFTNMNEVRKEFESMKHLMSAEE